MLLKLINIDHNLGIHIRKGPRHSVKLVYQVVLDSDTTTVTQALDL